MRTLLVRGLVALLLATPVAMGLSSCGGGAALDVKVTSEDAANLGPGQQLSFAPGDTPQFTVTVTNLGPGGASGVTVHVDLPADFRYQSTKSLGGTGVRTDPLDAEVNSTSPIWGVWNLASVGATAVITFQAVAGGTPGTYSLDARAAGDSTQGETQSAPVAFSLGAAPHISADAGVTPTSIRPGDQVVYRVTVTNDGSGIASGVAVLLTLPPTFAYLSSQPPSGNSSRDKPVDPVKGSTLVFSSGWNIPPKSSGGPGVLTLTFTAQCLKGGGPPGSFPAQLQVTDSQQERITLTNVAAVQVAPK